MIGKLMQAPGRLAEAAEIIVFLPPGTYPALIACMAPGVQEYRELGWRIRQQACTVGKMEIEG